MTELDNVVAALEELNVAAADYFAMGNSRAFAGMSFAMEDAVVDVKTEARQGLWTRLKAFIARAIEWIKKKFAGKKDPAQEIADNKNEIEAAEKKAEEEFDKFMASMKQAINDGEKRGAAQAEAIVATAKASAAAKMGERTAVPADFDEQVIKAVVASGLVQERSKVIIAGNAATSLLVASTGKVDVKATIDKADQLGSQLIPFCAEIEKLTSLKGQQLAEAFVALSAKTKELKDTASSFWGTEATANSKKLCESTSAEVLLKQMGRLDDFIGQRRVMTEVHERISRVTDRLGNLDLAEGVGEDMAGKIYGEGGAQELISGLMMHVAWANHYSSYGTDTKLRYINQFNTSKVGAEKIESLIKDLTSKFKIAPEEAKSSVLLGVGIAHLRLMNAQ